MKNFTKKSILATLEVQWTQFFMQKTIYFYAFFVLVFLSLAHSIGAQSIEEKRALLNRGESGFTPEMEALLFEVNDGIIDRQRKLALLHQEVESLYREGALEAKLGEYRSNISHLRGEILELETIWKNGLLEEKKEELYALWNQPKTTIQQLVIDYGSSEYVYVIPQAIGEMKLNVASSIAIPRAMWSEMLTSILFQFGIGVREFPPFVRELYLFSEDHSGLDLITRDRKELALFPRRSKVAFMVTPEGGRRNRYIQLLDHFANAKRLSFKEIDRDILLIGAVEEIEESLSLLAHLGDSSYSAQYRIFPLKKVDTEEMGKILEQVFEELHREGEGNDKKRRDSATSLKIIPLKKVANALFLLGTKEEIGKAEAMIQEIEGQIGDARGKVLHTYRAKHSDPEELAQLLQKIYSLLVVERSAALENGEEKGGEGSSVDQKAELSASPNITLMNPVQSDFLYRAPFPTTVDDQPNFYQSGGYVVNPAPVLLSRPMEKKVNEGRDNFIVDPKTGMIVMVVEPDILPRLKLLIRRVDAPKAMVQLDILLFEKRLVQSNQIGLNLFRIGGKASNTNLTALTWNDTGNFGLLSPFRGVLQFFLSRERNDDHPAYDLTYRFLMTQDDVTVHSNPTVTTLNQTPASINIVEEISINTGVVEVQSAGGVQAKDAFTRAQYGISIVITPTIHMQSLEWEESLEGGDYVTLETQVTFDDIDRLSNPQRPDVTRRNIKNTVNINDGETVILGGLRRKNSFDGRETIPFFGEIPGFGKLFRNERMEDRSTEMFIFITPRIITDPCSDVERIRCEQLRRRPGDLPLFLAALDQARMREKERLLEQTMRLLKGTRPSRYLRWGNDCCQGHY